MPVEKTVFISYRRATSLGFALAIHQNLTARGYDVFFDYDSIKSGDFEQIILRSIESRAHFVVILTPSALERCSEPGDWLLREIEHALQHRRNIVPLTFQGFDFKDMHRYLPAYIADPLNRYNRLDVPTGYFNEAMNRLTERLNVPLDAILHPPSPAVRAEEQRQKAVIADKPAVTEQQLKAEWYFERGLQHQKLGNHDFAIEDYSEAIRLKPDDADAYYNRGNAKDDKGDHDGAIADYDQAIRLQPDYAAAYNNRGAAKNAKGDREGAIADYTHSIKLNNPNLYLPYNNRGNAKGDKGDREGAIADYDQAIRLKPDYAAAYYNRGLARYNKGDHDGAIADYTEAIRLKPDFAEAYVGRGLVKDIKGDHDGAIADYNQGIRLKPDYATAYASRGIARDAKGDYDGAIADLQSYLDLGGGEQYNDRAEVEDIIHRLKLLRGG